MPDLTKSELAITLNGTERIWRLDWKAIRQLENAATQLEGKRVVWSQFLARHDEWAIDDFALILWAGLHRKDPSLTYETVMDEAGFSTFYEFSLAFNELLVSSIPERFKKKSVAPAATAPEQPPETASDPEKSALDPVSVSA
jgi:hypothetical protein